MESVPYSIETNGREIFWDMMPNIPVTSNKISKKSRKSVNREVKLRKTAETLMISKACVDLVLDELLSMKKEVLT